MGIWSSKEDQLHLATQEGDGVKVTQLLDSGVSVNCAVAHRSLLYTAILCGRYDLSKYFIQRGARITSGFYTDTPLHLASRMGAGDLVKYLLKCGASVNLTDHNNCTPLWGAVAENKMAAVQVLLRHPGIDINQPCSDRFMKQGECTSPLLEAVETNNLELISLLCQHGADLEQEDSKRHKPLHRASSLGYSHVVDVLISKGSNVDVVDDGNVTPLYLACERGYLQIATMLINAGCDVTLTRNMNGWKHRKYSPLHIAAQEGHTDIVRLLCNTGTDVDATECLGKTPLISACDAGHIDIMEILLTHDADVNQRDVFGHTPIFYALQSSQRWLKRKFDRSRRRIRTGSHNRKSEAKQDHYDENAFSVRAMQLLLKHGAEMNFKDNLENTTPTCHAVIFGHVDTVCVLLQHGAELHSTDILVEHLKWDNLSMLKLLLFYSQEFSELADRFLKTIELDPDVNLQLEHMPQKPDSLLRICRHSVRDTLRKRTQRTIKPFVETLPVPSTLKRFILYEDMYDLVFHFWEKK